MDTNTSQHTLKILHDDTPSSPRDNDNIGTFAGWHRRYTLGDVQPKVSPPEYLESLPQNSLVVPVYMMDHSGVALSINDFGDRWDSGQVGVYHLPAAKIIEEYGEDTPENRATAIGVIKAEVEEYGAYINGECWGYVVEDAQGNTVDSCWGFIGNDVLDNGLVDNLPSEYLDQLESAADQAGLSCSATKLAEWKERVAAYQAKQRNPGPSPG